MFPRVGPELQERTHFTERGDGAKSQWHKHCHFFPLISHVGRGMGVLVSEIKATQGRKVSFC